MTHEQSWAFYKLIPRLLDEGLIELLGDTDEVDLGDRILQIAGEDGVAIDAYGACDACQAADAEDADEPD